MSDSLHDLLRVEDLAVEFTLPAGKLRAVDGVSFRVPRGKIVALVGESGSGKTVIGQSITGLLPRNGHILAG
ncbi:MAG: ATP-binding cassette domain-containing protein, partial [Alphaproteobacteria bacterium]